MDIHRLGFAGIQLTSGEHSLIIDACTTFGGMAQFVGEPQEPLPDPGPAQLALVTHLHRDHADAGAIRTAGATKVLRPAPEDGEPLETVGCAEAEAELVGLEQQVVAPWETVTEGPWNITAVPAADGFGDPQLSWVVEADGRRILHAGDTLFHGWWWRIAMRLGPIDVAFLPVNGAVADLPHRQPSSPLAACMDPQQAAVGATLVRARLAIPNHYGAVHSPPLYAQVDDPAGQFLTVAKDLGVEAREVGIGEVV